MRIISRYLGKTMIYTILAVVIVFVGIDAFIEFTREFPDVGNGDYGLLQALIYVPMILPTNVYQLFPMAGLLGSVVGLGLLASHSELIIMRASGMAIKDIAWEVIKTALLLSLIMVFVGEVLAPWLEHKATVSKTLAISGGQALLTRQGIWLKDNNNYIHIQKVMPAGKLQEITRYSFDDQNKLTALEFAAEANYQHNEWICSKVVTTNIGDNTTSSVQADTKPCEMKFKPRLLSLTASDSEQKTLFELHRYIKYLHQSGLNSSSYEFTFWQRMFQPLAIIVMIILAVPFVFGPLRSATMGLRMLIAIVIGFAFYIFNQFIGPFSVVYQMPPILAALTPTVLFSLFGWLLLRRL